MVRRLLLTAIVLLAACGRATTPKSISDEFPIGPRDQPYTPVLVSSQTAVGENRFLLSLLDKSSLPAAAPDVKVDLAFYDLGGTSREPAFRTGTTFAYTIPGERGVYIARASFPKPGEWGVDATVEKAGEKPVSVRARFSVVPKATTPAPGDPAPRSQTRTLSDVGGDLSRITTDSRPDPSLYQLSVASAVSAGKPFVLVFSTPKFCTSRVCGPTLDRVKETRGQFPSVEVIHVEVVDPKDPLEQSGPQKGNIKPVPAVREWGLPSEPWVFVVDGRGTVSAAFEGFVTPTELIDAVRKVAS